MRSLFFALLLLASGLSGAADPRQYAVLSLIGDKLLVVQYYANEGFRNDGSLQAFVSLDDNSLDKTALQSVDQTLKKLEPATKPMLLVAQDTSLYEAHAALLRAGQSSKALLPRINPMLKGSGATHLILITKLRHEARVQQIKDTVLGSGMLEGLGFYVDAGRAGPNAITSAPAPAVFGPFTYYRIELVDLAKGEIVREELVVASRTFTTTESGNAWGALTNHDKVGMLQDMIRRETARAIPSLVRLAR